MKNAQFQSKLNILFVSIPSSRLHNELKPQEICFQGIISFITSTGVFLSTDKLSVTAAAPCSIQPFEEIAHLSSQGIIKKYGPGQ